LKEAIQAPLESGRSAGAQAVTAGAGRGRDTLASSRTGSAAMPVREFATLLVAGVFAANIFVFALIGLARYQSHTQYQDRAEVTTQNLVRALESDVAGSIRSDDLALLTVLDEYARRRAAGRVDGKGLNAWIEKLRARLPEVDAIRITDAEGILVYGTGVDPAARISLADRPHFVRLRDEPRAGLLVSRPQVSRINGRNVIVLARRIDMPGGSFGGMAFAAITLDHFVRKFAALNVGPHGAITLRDGDLNLIARFPELPGTTGAAGSRIVSNDLLAALKKNPDAGVYNADVRMDNTRRTNAYSRVNGYPLYVLVGLSTEDYLAEWHRQNRPMSLLAGLFALATILSAWLVFRTWGRKRALVAALAESEGRFRGIYENSQDVLIEVALDNGGTIVSVSPQIAELTRGQVLAADFVGRPAVSFWGDPALRDSYLDILMRQGHIRDYEVGFRSPDGSIIMCSLSGSVLRDATGRPSRLLVSLRDIRERKRSEEQLRLAAKVFENSGEAITITDDKSRILSVNAAFSQVTGYTLQEVVGQTPRLLKSGRHDAEFYRRLWQDLNVQGYWRGEIWNRRKSGEIYPEWLTISSVKDTDGAVTNYVAMFSDISERKAAQDRIEFLAFHDPLTRLPNRLLGKDRARQAIANADRSRSRVAAIFLDLDNFKLINDSLGHSVGDDLLVAVAARLQECLRETDTLCRLAGDEFLIILQNVAGNDAISSICEKVLKRLAEPFVLDARELSTSFSIGIAVYPDDGGYTEDLLKNSDTAMYRAKAAGRNTYRFFDEQMNVEATEHLHLREGLRMALDRGEFILHYQPQIDLASGRVAGVEALIRWRHPEFGLVPPGRFIPTAEDSGLIVPIGAWVLREACRQAVAWRQAGLPPLVVAINLSAVQFRRGNIEELVATVLAESGHEPALLELELTESMLIQDTEHILTALQRIKLLGVKLSIDDFGTGYSSLSYLKRFNVDKLKIDQSFIRDLATDPDDEAIVRAIILLAHSLNLRTVAEGVETGAANEYLRRFRCDEVQGYYFARPMPAEELAAYIGGNAATAAAK
jgi:diguanylate cyclase (GGDEF)-like protein/PAS domain S-box-containing protein